METAQLEQVARNTYEKQSHITNTMSSTKDQTVISQLRRAEKALNKAIASYEQKPAQKAKQTQKFERITVEEMRRRLNKIVHVTAASKRLTNREIWILLYERLRVVTGFNAITRSIEAGYKTHLDAVQEAGLLPLALNFAARMDQHPSV